MGPLSLCPFGTSKSKRSTGHHNQQSQQQKQLQQQQQQSSRHINPMSNNNNNTNNSNNVISSNNSINNGNINSGNSSSKTSGTNNNLNTLNPNGPIEVDPHINIRTKNKSKIQHHQVQQQQPQSPSAMHPHMKSHLQILNNDIHSQALTLSVQSSATSNRHRYVMNDFEPKVRDEIRVIQGDVVYFEYTDVEESGQSWAHVVCIRNNERGFIPSSLLTTDPVQPVQFKKKLPRGTAQTGTMSNIHHNLDQNHRSHHNHNPSNLIGHNHQNLQQHNQNNNHLNDNHNMIMGHTNNNNQLSLMTSQRNNIINPLQMQKQLLHGHTGQLSCNSENIQPHRHTFNHQPRFGISHSLQGSSGKQSLQKSCDSTHMGPPSYNHCLPQVLDLEPFYHDHNEIYLVLYNFVAREENDLSVRPGDYLIVLNKDDRDWFWVRREDDKVEGFVPAKFICEYEQAKSMLNKGNSISSIRSSSNQQSNDLHTYINHKPEKESTLTNTDQHSSLFHP